MTCRHPGSGRKQWEGSSALRAGGIAGRQLGAGCGSGCREVDGVRHEPFTPLRYRSRRQAADRLQTGRV